jgi:voltage-gated potassium channel
MGHPVQRPASAKAWDAILILLLVGSVAIVFWHESTRDQALRTAIARVDLALVVFFLGEWLWRVLRAAHPSRQAARQSWELLGMVPLMLPLPGFLRLLRLVRLVRILRVVGVVGRSIGVWERIARESSLHKIAIASGSVTIAGSLLVWAVERNTNPDLAHYSEAIWWAIVTVTTVGYGDVTPVTSTGRAIAALLMVTGIGTIGLLASSVAGALIVNRQEEAQAAGTLAAPPVMASSHIVAELERLAALHAQGKLTDPEFERAKSLVLQHAPASAGR